MLCYMDRTYCGSDCAETICTRYVSAFVKSDSERKNIPLAFSDFSPTCDRYKPPSDGIS